MLQLDHIAVAGATLDDATEFVQQALGVVLQPGGEHAHFGTHNRLLGLADGLYLEAIAINPDAQPPGRTRWFDLDRFDGPARLTNWICRTGNLAQTLNGLPGDTGVPVALSRGDLRWQMAVPETGRLPFDNLFPALIEWEGGKHPAGMLDDSGCSLLHLTVSHPQAGILRDTLKSHLIDPRITFETGAPGLSAEFDTPHGRRELG